MTGYTLMAFLASGNLPEEGEYSKNVASGVQYLLDHFHGQQRPERQIVISPIVGELVDDRATMPQDPELRRGGDPVNVIDTEP